MYDWVVAWPACPSRSVRTWMYDFHGPTAQWHIIIWRQFIPVRSKTCGAYFPLYVPGTKRHKLSTQTFVTRQCHISWPLPIASEAEALLAPYLHHRSKKPLQLHRASQDGFRVESSGHHVCAVSLSPPPGKSQILTKGCLPLQIQPLSRGRFARRAQVTEGGQEIAGREERGDGLEVC